VQAGRIDEKILKRGRYHHPAVSAGEIIALGEGAADAGEKIRLV
jgi:hypothetical protein